MWWRRRKRSRAMEQGELARQMRRAAILRLRVELLAEATQQASTEMHDVTDRLAELVRRGLSL